MSEPGAALIGIDASRAAKAHRTGTEGYAYHLLRELIPLAAARGCRVRLYFNQPPADGTFAAQPGADTRVLPLRRLWTHLRLGWELRQHPPDVFFTPAHVIPLTYHGPAVATVHDLGYLFFPQAHTWRQRAYLNWSTAHNARRSSRVLADSEATKQDLARLYGTPEHKIEVVYPGVDPELAPVTEPALLRAAQEKYGITAPYFLYLGTIQPRKNLQRLIAAHGASELPYQLVLAGGAGWRAAPITEAAASAAPGTVRLTGFVDEADKAALISGATALVYPSLYEGFGFPILEAQICGVPVLTARNSSLPEVAGDTALYVDAQDTAAMTSALQRLARDDELRRDLVAAGRENVRRFSWEAAAARTLALLLEAADK